MPRERRSTSLLGRPRRWAESWSAHWRNLTIRRRILVSMLAVSVIPLGLFSLAGVGAVAGLNSGALTTANHELVANQGAHLEDLVQSKAALVNDELSAIQTQIGLLGLAADNVLSAPPTQTAPAVVVPDAAILGPGATSAQPGSRVVALQNLEAEMAEIAELHPEVAEVWLQLPGSGLLAISPSAAITGAQKSQFEQLLPPQSEYQLGQQQVAASLEAGQWRSLVAKAPQTAVWTPVYSNPMAGGQTVTVSADGVTASGITFRAGANITVANLVSTFLLGPPGSAQGSYAFLVSGSGTVISVGKGGTSALGIKAKGKKQVLQAVSLTAPHNPWLSVGNKMRLGYQGAQQITLASQQVDVFYSPLPASRWSLGVALPVSGLDSSVVGFSQQISRGLTGVTVLLLPVLLLLTLLVVMVTNILTGRLLGPLSRLTGASERIAGGDLETAIPISSGERDELGILERTLEGMRRRLSQQRQQIDSAHHQLEHKVEERTAELTQRNQELATLNSLTGEMSHSLVVSDVADTTAAQLRAVWDLPEVAVYLADGMDPSGMRAVGGSLAEGASPAPQDETAAALQELAAAEFGSSVQRPGLTLMPLTTGGVLVGCLALRYRSAFGQRHLELLQVVGGQLALALRNAQLFADTQELATINERNRLAREIHDTLAQGLAGIIVQLEAADAWLGREPERSKEAVGRAAELARSSLHEARGSVWDLRPEGLQRAGLAGAVRDELARVRETTETKTSLRLRGTRGLTLPSKVEVAVYRIIREALANSLRHGQPGGIEVEMERSGSELRVVVSDDGLGFDPLGPVRSGSFGMTSMRERAESCGGSLELVSAPGEGTTVTVVVPCSDPDLRRQGQ